MKKMFLIFTSMLLMISYFSISVFAETEEDINLVLPDHSKYVIDAVNTDRDTNGITLYTGDFEEEETPAFQDDTTEYIVSNEIILEINEDGEGGTYIPFNNYVISASGEAKEDLKDLTVGDIVILENITIPQEANHYAVFNENEIIINKVNEARDELDVVLYDYQYGTTTGTNEWGIELVVLDGLINEIIQSEGNANIPNNGSVLSIQRGSSYFEDIYSQIEEGIIQEGDSIEFVQSQETHLASRINYDAISPRTQEDNPGGWDDANDKPFDGFRGTNQLIIYNTDYESASTGTNPWGYEVIVDDQNQVIAVGSNDSTIPEAGYVLSAHGDKAEWLEKYAKVNSKISINEDTQELIITLTPQSYVDRASFLIEDAKETLQTSEENFFDIPYDEISNKIAESEAIRDTLVQLLEEKRYVELANKSSELEQLTDEIINLNFESRKVEHRGIWIRPLEKNATEVRRHLEQIADANLNQVYVETWWNGYTIYPSENPLAPHNPMYNGFDVLESYLEIGEELGLEIHAWVHNGFLEDNKMEEKPEWSMIRRDGENIWEIDGYTWYWLNTALPDVQDFLIDLYGDMVERYSVDGLHLDYIRYPDNYGTEIDYGYDDYTRTTFMEAHNTDIDPIDLYPGDELWPEWQQFRMDTVTSFVERVVPEIKELEPSLAVTASVYSDFYDDPEFKLQDAGNWLENNYLDNVFLMSYKFDAASVVHDVNEALALAEDRSYVTAGLGPQAKVSIPVITQQVVQTQAAGASGSAFFEFLAYFGDRYNVPLKQGVFREEAIVPYSNPGLSVKTLLTDMVGKIDRIYESNQGMENTATYKQLLNELISQLEDEETIDIDASKLGDSLKEIEDTLNNDSTVNMNVKDRMIQDLNEVQQIIAIYNSKNPEEPVEPEEPVDSDPEPTDPEPGEPEDPSDPEPDPTDPTDPADPTDPVDQEGDRSPVEEDSYKSGEELPQTATSIFNYLLVGFLLVLVGIGTILFKRKKQKIK